MHFVATWQAEHKSERAGTFSIVPDGSDRWRLLDTRFNRPRGDVLLNREEVALAMGADKPIGRERLIRLGQDQGIPVDIASAGLEKLRSLGIIREVGERLVTLALLPDSVRAPFGEIPSGQNRETTWAIRRSSS